MEVVASLSQGRTAAAQCGLIHTNQSRSYLNHLVVRFSWMGTGFGFSLAGMETDALSES